MVDVFNSQYADAELQGTAATVSRAFDNSAQVQDRTRARYGLPALANFQKDWAIERARSVSDSVNRMRMMRSLTPAQQSQQSNNRARANGLAQLASVLLGREQYNKLVQDGLIKGVKDIFGNATQQGTPPTGQQELDAAGLYNERGVSFTGQQELDAAGLYNEQTYPDIYYQQDTYQQPEYVAPAEVMPDVFYQSE